MIKIACYSMALLCLLQSFPVSARSGGHHYTPPPEEVEHNTAFAESIHYPIPKPGEMVSDQVLLNQIEPGGRLIYAGDVARWALPGFSHMLAAPYAAELIYRTRGVENDTIHSVIFPDTEFDPASLSFSTPMIVVTFNHTGYFDGSAFAAFDPDGVLYEIRQAFTKSLSFVAYPREKPVWRIRPSWDAANHRLSWGATITAWPKYSEGQDRHYFWGEVSVLGGDSVITFDQLIQLDGHDGEVEQAMGNLTALADSLRFSPGHAYTDHHANDPISDLKPIDLMVPLRVHPVPSVAKALWDAIRHHPWTIFWLCMFAAWLYGLVTVPPRVKRNMQSAQASE